MDSRRRSGVIGITLGDCAGIGPEIIRAALASRKLDGDFEYRVIGESGNAAPGFPTMDTARGSMNALEQSARMALAGEIDAVVTGPIHKARAQAAGFQFPGQTEFFAARAGVEDFAMLLTGGTLTVALVTAHIPLKDVASVLSRTEIVRVGRLLEAFLRRRFRSGTGILRVNRAAQSGTGILPVDPAAARSGTGILPVNPIRIAVAGLNPHAGESGALGREEIEIIAPAVDELNGATSPDCAPKFTGPLSPDTVFYRAARGEFDAVLCMYHDQGLIPLKLHAFDDGVNVTIGLPFPRTSPDHGTAFEIAGKGVARPDSMISAIRLAAELACSRGRPCE